MSQSSIEWLVEQMTDSKELYDDQGYAQIEVWNQILAKAKHMHKQEIINAFNTADHMHYHNGDIDIDGHEYYEETYRTQSVGNADKLDQGGIK